MNLTDRVYSVLESWPASRDDEALLLASVWSNELEERRIKLSDMNVMRFFTMIMAGTLSPATAILSVRNTLQKSMMELRGENYSEVIGNIDADEL